MHCLGGFCDILFGTRYALETNNDIEDNLFYPFFGTEDVAPIWYHVTGKRGEEDWSKITVKQAQKALDNLVKAYGTKEEKLAYKKAKERYVNKK